MSPPSAAEGADAAYSPPLLARLFHSLPHLNIALRSVNSTFNPASEVYLESLGILASLPAAWLILSLFVLLIYLLTRCCERHPRRKRSIAALKWTLAVFTLLCCGAVALGLYGNDDVHNGLVQFVAAVRGAHTVVSNVVNQSSALEASLDGGLRPQVSEATAAMERSSAPMNASARGALLALVAAAARNATAASAAAVAISSPLRSLASSLDRAGGAVELAEAFRAAGSEGEMMKGSGASMSSKQQEIMLKLMEKHCVLAQNQLCGARVLLPGRGCEGEMCHYLNACPMEESKMKEKRLKCWQDWKSDTKGNSQCARKHAGGPGGGSPSKCPALTEVEERLLQIMGKIAHQGMRNCSTPFRWPVTMAVLSVLLVFCIILLFGVARHSRCALITFSVFGLFAVIVSWLLASLYLASSVALGDLCVAPAPYLEQRAASGAPSALEAAVQARLAHYYLRCDSPILQPAPTPALTPGGRASPLMPRLRDAQRSLLAVEEGVALAARVAPADIGARLETLTSALDRSRRLANTLPVLLDCRNLHRHYTHAAKSICDLGLYGLAFMLLSCLTAGLFFTVLVWVDSHTWIYIRKRDGREAKQPHHHHHHHQRGQHHAASTAHHRGPSSSSHHRPSTHSGPPAPSAPPDSCTSGPAGSSAVMLGPNNGQYPTLSKQCKTLESADFY